jgi:trigger factor
MFIMQIKLKPLNDTKISLNIVGDQSDLSKAKDISLAKLAPQVKVAGFRSGKVPKELVEKNLDPNYLQSQVLDEVVNNLFNEAVFEKKLRPVAQPKIELTKFVPYEQVEFNAEIEVIGSVKLPDYTKLGVKKQSKAVTEKDIDEVINRLTLQMAEFKEVDRPAKSGDRAWIDFEGKDSKGEEVKGATGKEYPLALGSNSFIPGFEDAIIGMKTSEDKKFTIPFPKDYGVKALQGKKVTFKVKLVKLEETIKPALDDKLAEKAGPFKSLKDLKADIKKQLETENANISSREFEDNIVKTLAKKTKVELPEALINEQVEIVDREFQQNLSYRGENIKDYLANSNQSEEDYKKAELIPVAIERLKAGLALSEVAEKEGINITPEELEIRLQVLKGQYTDPKMQEELNQPSAKKDIASRLLTEKTIAKLVSLQK